MSSKKQIALDAKLHGNTFALTFVKKREIQDDDLMLVLDANMQQDRLPFRAGSPAYGPAYMVSAALNVMDGASFKKEVDCVTQSSLAIKLVRL